MAAVNQTQVLQDMSYLLGEQSVPTTSIDDRKQFIQNGLTRILTLFPFDDVNNLATLSVTNTGNFYQATLPLDINFRAEMDVRVINPGTGDDYVFDQVTYSQQDDWTQGDNKYWYTGSEGNYTLFTRESYPALSLRYYAAAPTINASVSTTFPSSLIIARAAIVYYRQSENPQADVSVDEALFQKELAELVAREQLNRPQRRARSIAEKFGKYTGDVSSTSGNYHHGG